MTAIVEPLYLDDIISEYLAGKPGTQIARERGHDYNTVRNWLAARGVLRSRSDAEVLKYGLSNKVPIELAAAEYAAGSTLDELSQKYQVSRSGIKGLFLRNGIAIRTKSDGIALGWKRGRQPNVVSGWNKGLPQPLSQRIKKAQSIERNPLQIGADENEARQAIGSLGVDCIPQYALGPYNLDLALPKDSIAIEIQVGNVTSEYTSLRHERVEYILGLGWSVIFVFRWQHQAFDFLSVAKNLVSIIEYLRTNPAIRGQYGVIGCDGDATTIPGFETDCWTLIPIPETHKQIA